MPGTQRALTPRQSAFVQQYLIDRNGKQAAIRAGYAPGSAKEQAARLLTNANVDRVVTSELKRLGEKHGITVERVLEEYAKLAFLDPASFYDEDGALIPVHLLPKETAAALTGMDVKEMYKDGVPEAVIKKIKFSDKRGALDSLAKHLGMFVEKTESRHDIHITWGNAEQIEDKPIDVTPLDTPSPANPDKVGNNG
jgi:phage terminase small subunit